MSPHRSAVPLDAAPAIDENNPWPGLLAFSEDFHRFFFGRGVELDDLFRRVRRETLTVLYAQSGLGKTSLLQAGLFPRLRQEGFLPIPIRLDFGEAEVGLRGDADPPGRQVAHAIATAIKERGLREASDPLAAPGPWEYLHDLEFDLPDETGSPLTPVLVLDQFEELFTLGAGRRDQGRFVDRAVELLGNLIENRVPQSLERALAQNPALVDRYTFTQANYRVLLSLREDYLPHLHGLREAIPSIILNNVRLTRFDRRQALEVVERPAAQRYLVSRTVAEAIVQTVAGRESTESTAPRATESISKERPSDRLEVDPALLSLFCRELNGLRIERGEAAISLDLVAGSKETVLRDFYIDCFQNLSPPPEPGVKAFVEDYLLTSKGYRDRLTLERATEILVSDYNGHAEELGVLVNRRLLQIEERGKTPQIELTHDVLAPIALRERTERVHNEELRRAEEKSREDLRHAEQEEREARARAEAAAAALATARRQQRRTMALLGVVAIAAGGAIWLAVVANKASGTARSATHIADSIATVAVAQRDTQKLLADSVVGQQAALEEKTQTAQREQTRAERLAREAQRARDSMVGATEMANTERARSDSLVAQFCVYQVDLINSLGDSTASNSMLLAAYNTLLERSDTAISVMISRSPETACLRRLDARTKTVSTQIHRQLEQPRATRSAAVRALTALHALARFNDSVSRRVGVESYLDLTYELYLIASRDSSMRETAIRAASEGAVLAETFDPARDSSTFDRPARLRHYAALILIQARRFDSAKSTLDAALEGVAKGERRRDQRPNDLGFTESQLWMRRGELDSATGRKREALVHFDSAVAVARRRHSNMFTVASRRWLAIAHRSKADLALSLGEYGAALSAYDSSAASWGQYARRMLAPDVHDTANAESALLSIAAISLGQARASLALGRLAAAANYARQATDSAGVAAGLRNTSDARRSMRNTYSEAFSLFEDPGPRARADSVFEAWFRRDSLRAAADLSGAPTDIRVTTRAFDGTVDQVLATLLTRFRADTVGKPVADQAAIQRGYQTANRRYREAQVWIHRELYRRTGTAGAKDSLGEALGNLSWSYLFSTQPQDLRTAATLAEEGISLAPGHSFIIPNWFNAVLLGGTEEGARLLFIRFAGQDVENPAIRFECAVERDLRLLRAAGVAEDRHLALLRRFLGDQPIKCQSSPTPTP